MTNTRTTLLAVLAVGLLAVSAVALPVAAKEGDDDSQSGREAAQQRAEDQREARKQHAEEQREAAKQRSEEHREAAKQRCLEHQANATLNETDERDCMKLGEFAEKAFKARRAAHALLGAINATERQWARLNATEDRLEARLASGNLSANETERIEHRLEKIDAKQERLADRLEALKERLAKLHDKWAAVREHVDERRRGHDDDDSESSSESASESTSESVSSSESSSESASSSQSESSSSSSPPA